MENKRLKATKKWQYLVKWKSDVYENIAEFSFLFYNGIASGGIQIKALHTQHTVCQFYLFMNEFYF